MIYLYDVTRIIGRKSQVAVTGIDRVDCTYLSFLLSNRKSVIFLNSSSLKKKFEILDNEEFINVLTSLFNKWQIGYDKQNFNPYCFINRSTDNIEQLVKNLDFEFFVYLNIGQTRLNDQQNFELDRLSCYSNFRSVFYIHDVIPIDYPEYTVLYVQVLAVIVIGVLLVFFLLGNRRVHETTRGRFH